MCRLNEEPIIAAPKERAAGSTRRSCAAGTWISDVTF
jgi:hypothetical protein